MPVGASARSLWHCSCGYSAKTRLDEKVASSLMGQEHACRPPGQDGESNSVTGRNRCAAEDFCLVPVADVAVSPGMAWRSPAAGYLRSGR